MKKITLFFATAALFGCGGSFSANDLNATLYQGYWAMSPVGDLHRVLKFHPDGVVKIYEYQCEGAHYRLTDTHTHYLRTAGRNQFTVLDDKRHAFAKFEIQHLAKAKLSASQTFLDKSIQPNRYPLTYHHQIGAKPLCDG